MPHDARGNFLEAGDKVNIPATIKSVTVGEFCTTEVELDIPMPPYENKMSLWVNAAQVIKVEDDNDATP